MYGITDPLECLEKNAPPKKAFKQNIMSKITSFHERELRKLTENNTAMKYLNVSVLGLTGRAHPEITGVTG